MMGPTVLNGTLTHTLWWYLMKMFYQMSPMAAIISQGSSTLILALWFKHTVYRSVSSIRRYCKCPSMSSIFAFHISIILHVEVFCQFLLLQLSRLVKKCWLALDLDLLLLQQRLQHSVSIKAVSGLTKNFWILFLFYYLILFFNSIMISYMSKDQG